MKRILSTIAVAAIFATQAYAQTFDIDLRNGNSMRVQVCSDHIFRIRIASDATGFPETLMERYGIIRTDWDCKSGRISQTSSKAAVRSGACSLVIDKKDGTFSMMGADGRTIIEKVSFLKGGDSKTVAAVRDTINRRFKGVNKSGGIVGEPGHEHYETLDIDEGGRLEEVSMLRFSLKDGERFYGGGNTSRQHIQHRGEILRMLTTYQSTEIPIPFVLSSACWGVFNNTTFKNFFDIGCTDKDHLNIYNTVPTADFYLFDGESMNDVINLYTDVTGKTFVLPKYAYGFNFGPNMLENMFEFLGDALRFREEKVPCDLMWIEPQWMEKYYDYSTSKNWNYKLFPGEPYWVDQNAPKSESKTLFVGRLHGLGFKLALWLCMNFDQSITEEDMIARREGRPESGQEHWFDHLTRFIDQGVDGFKLDPGNTIAEHPDREYYNGSTDAEMHNLNQVLMPKQMYLTFRNHTGRRSFHHYCGGYAGTQHWSASQSGDNGGGRTALFDQLNLNFSGYMNTSCDVMAASDEMAALHMGVFLPWVQVNSWFSLLHPWYFPEKQKNMYRDYVQLRYDLLPYIYSAALKGAQFGSPVLQAMPFAFPDDRNVDDMVYQYMFGESFLVGVFSDKIYLPKGSWINYWTGEKVEGKAAEETFVIPEDKAGLLFVKDGSIIPTTKGQQFITGDAPDSLIVKVFPHGSSSYTLYEDDGVTYRYEDGAIAATRFVCVCGDGRVDFTINAMTGSFDGMVSERTYTIEIRCDAAPAAVKLNGSPVDGWSYGSGTLTVPLGSVKTTESSKLSVIL